MALSAVGRKLIEDSEGERLEVYHGAADLPGVLTVGVGHKVRPQDNLKLGDTITQAQCDEFLDSDAVWAETIVNRLVIVDLTQGQFDALVDFVFNMGSGAFAVSSILTMLNSGNPIGAANELMRYVYSNHKVEPGLVMRRKAECDMFLGMGDT